MTKPKPRPRPKAKPKKKPTREQPDLLEATPLLAKMVAREKPNESRKATKKKVPKPQRKPSKANTLERIRREQQDSFDEELEMELDDQRLAKLVGEIGPKKAVPEIDRQIYFRELFRLQGELVKLQDWVQATGAKIVVLFEGRDAAGKGGAIKRITQRMNPRIARVAALPAPSDRERSQWYFQRYVPYLPAAGEIVLFDRSWYNRAGVERVMGFTKEPEIEEFYRSVPELEKMFVRSGIILVKYWFSISDAEQHLRFIMRLRDPLKQWKLSPMDLESRRHWERYTKAKEVMLERTNIPEARWWIVEADDKKRARLNCIAHLLSQIPYKEVQHPEVILPERQHDPNYSRGNIPASMYVPEIY